MLPFEIVTFAIDTVQRLDGHLLQRYATTVRRFIGMIWFEITERSEHDRLVSQRQGKRARRRQLPVRSLQPKMVFKVNVDPIEQIDDEFIAFQVATVSTFVRYVLSRIFVLVGHSWYSARCTLCTH